MTNNSLGFRLINFKLVFCVALFHSSLTTNCFRLSKPASKLGPATSKMLIKSSVINQCEQCDWQSKIFDLKSVVSSRCKFKSYHPLLGITAAQDVNNLGASTLQKPHFKQGMNCKKGQFFFSNMHSVRILCFGSWNGVFRIQNTRKSNAFDNRNRQQTKVY